MIRQQSISTADNTTVTEMRINSHHNIIHNSIHTYAFNAPVLSSAETFFNAYIAVLIPTIFNHIDKHFLLTWLYDSNWTDWQCTHFYCCFLLFTSQYKKYLYGYMDVQTITNTFSEDFQQFRYTGKERENSCTNFLNSSLSCHQLEPPETAPNRGS